MNDSSGMDSFPSPGVAGGRPAGASAPAGWGEALGLLISARIGLLQLESRAAARQAGESVASVVAALLAVIFAWALALAGGIAALAAATSWPWYWLALAAALLHVLAAAICLRLARSPRAPTFPITRAEFHKDREWLATLKTPPKSND